MERHARSVEKISSRNTGTDTGKVVCSQVSLIKITVKVFILINCSKCKISQHVYLITDCTLTRTALDSVQVLLSVRVSARL